MWAPNCSRRRRPPTSFARGYLWATEAFLHAWSVCQSLVGDRILPRLAAAPVSAGRLSPPRTSQAVFPPQGIAGWGPAPGQNESDFHYQLAASPINRP